MSDPSAPSATFCVIPWVHVFADEMGYMRPCCMAIGTREMQNVDEQGRPHMVSHAGGVDPGWNSPFMRDLRRQMLAGETPAVCRMCFDEEALAIRSYRQDANQTHAAVIDAAVAATSADHRVPTSLIRSVDLRLGNLCNLKCRMCSPVSSRLLIPEWRTLFNVAADDPRLAALESVDWFSADTLWENCAALAPQVQTLHFAGGEPLLITRMLDFLSRLVEHGSAPGITLSYVTNLTTLPERVVTLWPRFAAVSITVSLDGAGPLNTYIRFPSKWENIDAHLTALVRDPGRFNCAALTINTTVQAYNVLRLDALCEYVMCHVAPHVTSYPRLTLLQWPSCMSVQVLPPELKMLATSRLRAFVRRWATRWPVQGEPLDRFLASIEGVIAHMHARDGQHEFAEFVRRTLVFDRERHQDIRVILPELAAAVDAVAGP